MGSIYHRKVMKIIALIRTFTTYITITLLSLLLFCLLCVYTHFGFTILVSVTNTLSPYTITYAEYSGNIVTGIHIDTMTITTNNTSAILDEIYFTYNPLHNLFKPKVVKISKITMSNPTIPTTTITDMVVTTKEQDIDIHFSYPQVSNTNSIHLTKKANRYLIEGISQLYNVELKLQGELDTEQLRIMNNDSSGINLTFSAYNIDNWQMNITNTQTLTLGKYLLNTVNIALNNKEKTLSGLVDITGSVNTKTLNMKATLEHNTQNTNADIAIQNNTNNIVANLRIVSNTISASGKILLNNISTLIPTAVGAFQGNFAINGDTAHPNIVMNLSGKNIFTKDISIPTLDAAFTLNQAYIDTAYIRLENARFKNLLSKYLNITAKGTIENHEIDISNDETLHLLIHGKYTEYTWKGILDTFSILQFNQIVKLQARVKTLENTLEFLARRPTLSDGR